MNITEYQKLMSKPNKFHARKTVVDGITFDSKHEANRYCELKALERAGAIQNLERQTAFLLVPKSRTERAVTYKADFQYVENGRVVVEDAKGHRTKDYIIKRKLFKQLYPDIDFREV